MLDQNVSTSSSSADNMQHLASAADVLHIFEDDTATDTQQHLDITSDPLVVSSTFNPATAADLQLLDISDRLPPAAIVLPISLNPVSHLEWEAGILLMLRNKFYLPFEALLYVSDAIHDSYQASVQTIYLNISYTLLPQCWLLIVKLHMLQDKLKTLLLTEVVGSTSFREAFETVHYEDQLTRFRLESLRRKFFPTIMPQSVILSPTEPSYDWVSDPQFGFVLDEVFETGYIVPFLNSLHQFLSIKEVYDSVMSNFSTQTTDPVDCYADVWDGSFVKSLPLFIQHHGNILGIQLYMDEVELSNPLGSKKG